MIVHACAVPMNVPGLLRITAAALFWLLPSSSVFLSAAETETGSEVTVWIGTGKSSLSQGIYVCSLDQKTGKLTVPVLAAEAEGPGFLAMHPRRTHVYAVCGVSGKPSVAAYAVEKNAGRPSLRFVNSVEVGDGGGTHISVDATGRSVLTAQYGGGSVAIYSLNDDGSLKARTQLIDHQGASGAVPGRQDASHAHWSGRSPDNRFAFVPDLGLDKVVIYEFDAAGSRLTPHGYGELPAGSGPRHMKFHPNGKWAYVLNEISLTITLFMYDAEKGVMTPVETVATVPDELKAKEKTVSAAEIRIHPNGKFVYSSNRTHDTISAFEVHSETGKLTLIEREPVRGATPRNFNLDPSGRWLLAAGQDSHTLGVFEVNQETGELTWNMSSVFAPTPICVMFGPE
jgi:6-phosphogluconolactonase